MISKLSNVRQLCILQNVCLRRSLATVPSLPRIKVPIGHIPQRLKSPKFDPLRGRLEILRSSLTRLVREERIEIKYNRAEELRPYMERLIQLGIHRGMNDEYTNEMMNWWLMEKDLLDKMEHVIIPRFKEMEEPYTNLFRLPRTRYVTLKMPRNERYQTAYIGVIELKGNPFPEIGYLENERLDAIYEFVKSRIGEQPKPKVNV
uniref:Large ribosomal subunit protein bL17m n=1 Tax=Panagrolaimus davidi TaxID=227884 RepID=A0A914QAN8_9BILA